MRYIYLIALCVLLSACGPIEPTGNVVASATNNGDVLITYSTYEDGVIPATRINIRGDVVAQEFYVDQQLHTLSGSFHSEGYLSGTGTAVLRLEPGTYKITGVSCEDMGLSIQCTRIGRNIRI